MQRIIGPIFGIIGRIASDVVTLKSECISVLLCALEVCNLSKGDLQFSNFAANLCYEITSNLRTSDIAVVANCQEGLTVSSIICDR